MRLIVFGIGKVYRAYGDKMVTNNIVAYTDNRIDTKMFEQKPLIAPSQIKEWDYDYVVIFTSNYFEQIYRQLIYELHVPESKVISYLDVIDTEKRIALHKCGKYAIKLIGKMQWSKVLDVNAFLTGIYYTRTAFEKNLGYNVDFDACTNHDSKLLPIYNNIYGNIYDQQDKDNLPEYDGIILVDMLKGITMGTEEEFRKLASKARYLFIVLPYYFDETCEWWNLSKMQYLGDIIYSEYREFGKCLIIDTKYRLLKSKVKIYSVGHKAFEVPTCSLYEPIYVGEHGKKYEFEHSDSRGDNIAEYNEAINETTALYWIWKNANEDNVGLCHYRRYFRHGNIMDTEMVLQEPFVNNMLEKYDIILPEAVVLLPNVKEQLERDVNARAFDEGWKIITVLIKNRQPDYWDAFEYIFNGVKMYPCNMFVGKKEMIDKYCEWLFSFILDAVKAIDISQYDNYSKRIVGFFVERLFNVWLVKQNLKIKELPILMLE